MHAYIENKLCCLFLKLLIKYMTVCPGLYKCSYVVNLLITLFCSIQLQKSNFIFVFLMLKWFLCRSTNKISLNLTFHESSLTFFPGIFVDNGVHRHDDQFCVLGSNFRQVWAEKGFASIWHLSLFLWPFERFCHHVPVDAVPPVSCEFS